MLPTSALKDYVSVGVSTYAVTPSRPVPSFQPIRTFSRAAGAHIRTPSIAQKGFDMPAKGFQYPIAFRLQRRSAINEKTGCIEWVGVTNRGYGVLKVGNTRDKAHRLAWIAAHGEIPQGFCVLHRCDNPKCINPTHLFLGTKGDNNRDRKNKGRSRNQHTGRLNQHCTKGV